MEQSGNVLRFDFLFAVKQGEIFYHLLSSFIKTVCLKAAVNWHEHFPAYDGTDLEWPGAIEKGLNRELLLPKGRLLNISI
jgi:hypothetical protein